MQTKRNINEIGSVLLCVLGAILIVSLIGASVLSNSTTRLNASTNHVRAWKESLSAAETGGDIGFAEVRKTLSDPSHQWETAAGWTNSGTKHTSAETTFGSSNLIARTVVEECYFDPTTKLLTLGHPATGNPWYRIRSKGTAPLPNLKRTGMDDALINDGLTHFAPIGSTAMQDITARGKGNSLLRKIDFKYDHFIAAYGPNGDRVNAQSTPASHAPSISRRIEQIVTPVTPFFDAAIKVAGDFRGLGDASYIDSFDSRKPPYHYYFCADNPADPNYIDSRHGSVEVDSATVTVRGTIYGDVATNGGNIVSNAQHPIYGTIDNNVPFTLSDYQMPNTSPSWLYVPAGNGADQLPAAVTSGNQALTPRVHPVGPPGGTNDNPTYYMISSLSGKLTVNPILVGGNPVDTYVAIRVTGGDITGGIVVKGGTVDPTNPYRATGNVHLKIYFDYNVNTKNSNLQNQSPTALAPYAGNMQFYGISPPRDVNGVPVRSQSITLGSGSPGLLAATFYAPSADVQENGNPDFIGTIVGKSFYSNGNIAWHYDRALNDDGELQDFRVASYVEDTR